MRLRKFLALFAILPMAVVAAAQMPGPVKEIEDLAWMVGDWTGKAKWTLPGMPEMEIDLSYKCVMEGTFVKTTNEMNMMGMTITESQYLTWDPEKKRYSAWTFTNMAALPRIEHGLMEGVNLVLISEPWAAGMPEPVVSRATMTKKSDTEATFFLEFKSGEKWDKVGEGTFTKKI